MPIADPNATLLLREGFDEPMPELGLACLRAPGEHHHGRLHSKLIIQSSDVNRESKSFVEDLLRPAGALQHSWIRVAESWHGLHAPVCSTTAPESVAANGPLN